MSNQITNLINRLQTRASELRGKKGVIEARALADRVALAAWKHAMNMAGNPRNARSEQQISRGRDTYALTLKDTANGYPLAAFGRPANAESWPIKKVTELTAGVREIARVGSWWISTSQSEEKDWNYYSKAWHRSHGPKVTISDRKVLIRRYNPATKKIESRDQDVTAWRGNWALNALIDAGVIEGVKAPTKIRPVQLHHAFAVELHRKHGDFTVYRRMLAGDIYDFCAFWHGLTYHAESPITAIRGLKNKIHVAEKRRNSPINWALCRELGFCEEGIKQFCRDFSLSPKGEYTPEEIRKAVEHDISSAIPYASELKTLAKAVGYAIPASL